MTTNALAAVAGAEAERMVAAAAVVAERLGLRSTIVLVDADGEPIAELRMKGARRETREIALAKAFVACSFDLETQRLVAAGPPSQRLFAELLSAKQMIVSGGIPLKRRSIVVGAVGVSGGDAAGDQACAEAAVGAWPTVGGQPPSNATFDVV